MAKKSLEDIIHGKYEDETVAEFILQQVNEAKTADKIMSGELVLPGEADAVRNHQIATGTFAATPNEAKLRDENNQLKQRLDAIEARLQPKPEHKG